MATTKTASRHPGLNLGSDHQNADDAAENSVFGFWVFMMSDALIFGLLLATYVTMHHATAGAPGLKDLFDLKSIAIETLMLLLSSVTFGMASLAMKYDTRRGPLISWLVVTLLLGTVFLGFELNDFHKMIAHGGAPQRSGCLSAFWALVPLHGLHVAAASVWMMAIFGQMLKYGVDDDVKISLLRLGVLWHFLDVIWIGIFSVVYIGGMA